MDRQLQRQNTCQKLNLDGGWYVLLRVPVTSSDEELAVRLLRDAQVLTHPGHFYDFATDGYLVLSLITPAADFREGLARILKLLES
jgi:aspartate/methionine/tyrosine aminotransferase